jgi:aerobic carbon-monoxide dehydrogenase large subunit
VSRSSRASGTAATPRHSIECQPLGLSERQVRVITPDVGGAFGPKLVFYPEDVAVASRLLTR